jgi:hypothetical protein
VCADANSIGAEAGGFWPGPIRRGLLRTIGIDVRHLRTSRSALPYVVAALAMCFYLPYGTWAISHALGLANGGSGQITVVMLIGAVCVTGVIIGFDALIISYVAVNHNDLDDTDARPIGKLSKAMIGLRLVIAVVMVGVFTIPTLLFFFQRETTADLAGQNQQAIASYVAHGPPAQIQAQINKLTNQETSDPNSVLALENRASALDKASASDYQLALQDSAGNGLTHLSGCPVGGDCWTLQQKSLQETSQANALRQQANALQASQKAQLSNDAAEITTLTQRRNADIQSFSQAQGNNTGLGARTKSLVSLAVHDPFGIGLAAAIILAVATLLELAVLGIKVTASRNSEYELSVAREARRALKAQAELDWAADGIAGEAMAEVRVDPGLRETAFHTRRRQLEHMLRSRVGPIPEPYALKEPPRTEPAEPPNTLVDHQTVRPIAPPALADRPSNGHIEQPTLADQPGSAFTGQPSTLGDDPGAEQVEEPTTLRDGPSGTEPVEEPSTLGVRALMGPGPRSALELQLLTARVPAMSNAGRVTALAVVAGVALALVVWGVG